MKVIREDVTFEGQPLSLQTGRYAKQADGSVWCQYGGTVLLATVVSGKDAITEEQDFFPLTVDYIEKFYAAGRFPGGFLKRETQPSTGEKLTARLIDRPIRPLFPKWFQNDTHVIITVLSYDEGADPKVMAITAASAAISISDIPFDGPIGAVRVIKRNGEFFINPPHDDAEDVDLNIVLAASKDSIVMVEGEAKEASEEDISEALMRGHEAIQTLVDAQNALVDRVAPVKRPEVVLVQDAALESFVREIASEPIAQAAAIPEKLKRYAAIADAKKVVVASVMEKVAKGDSGFADTDSPATVEKRAKRIYESLVKEHLRSLIVEKNIRIDGRDLQTVRPITIDTGVLPKVHGSAVFTRGETQSLGTVTLGVASDEQRVDTMTDVDSRKFMLHYNFPPFSVGEVGRLRAPGRRELGHGMLAERALQAVVPMENFDYTIRVVSEILESNGSSSMATVCSGCLAMMDAGVPIKKHVAGIAMGLIKHEDNYIILTDILGDEDHLGDMDFKVAGTKDGITAIQMDIKIKGLPKEVMERAMLQAKVGRMHIIGEMEKALPEHRPELSPNAPKMFKMNIKTDKIRDLIGTGGKNIRAIVEETEADVNVEQDGTVIISAKDQEHLDRAIQLVHLYTDSVEVGKIYEGTVTRVEDYGAFVEVMPGQTGLLHVSKIKDERVESVADLIKVGDKMKVIVTEIEFGGKFKLSTRPSDFERDFSKVENRPPRRDRHDRHDRHDRDGRRSRDRR